MSLSRLKKADDRTKYTIFGYCRQCSNQLSLNLPMMIQYLVLLHYWIYETFSKYGDNIVVNKEKNIIKGCNGIESTIYNTIYGNNVIEINDKSIKCYKWIFKILSTQRDDLMCDYPISIGIDSSNKKYTNQDFSDKYINKHLFYAIGTDGYKYTRNGSFDIMADSYNGNQIELRLNMEYTTLSVKWGNNEPVSFSRIDFTDDKQYNLAISMPVSHQNQIQLINFTVSHWST